MSVLLRLKEIESSGIVAQKSLSHQKTILAKIVSDSRLSKEEQEKLALAVLDGEFGIQFILNPPSEEESIHDQSNASESLFQNDYGDYSKRFETNENANPRIQLVGSVASIPSVTASELLQQQHNKKLYSAFESSANLSDDVEPEYARVGGPGGGFFDGDKYHPILAKPQIISQQISVELGLSTTDINRVSLTSADNLAVVSKRTKAEQTKKESDLVRELIQSRESSTSKALVMTKELKSRLSMFRKAIYQYLRKNNHELTGAIMRCIDEGLAFEFLEKYHEENVPVGHIIDLMTVRLGSDLLPPNIITPQKSFDLNDDGMIFVKSGGGSVVSSVVLEPQIQAVSAGYDLKPHTKCFRLREETPVFEHRQKEELAIDLVIRKKGNSINNTPFLYPLPYKVSTDETTGAFEHPKPWNRNPVGSTVSVAGSGFRSKSPEFIDASPLSPITNKLNSPKSLSAHSSKKVTGNNSGRRNSAQNTNTGNSNSNTKKKGILLRRPLTSQKPDDAVEDETGDEGGDSFEDDDGSGSDGDMDFDNDGRGTPHKRGKKGKKMSVAELEKQAEELLNIEAGNKSTSDHFRIAESAAIEQKFIETYLTRHNIISPPGEEAADLQNLDVFVENSSRGNLARSMSKAFKKSNKAKFTVSTKVIDGNTFLETVQTADFTDEGLVNAVKQQNKELGAHGKVKSTKFLAAELKITKQDLEFRNGRDSIYDLTDRVNDLTARSTSGKVTPKYEYSNSARGAPAESLQAITDIVSSVVPLLTGEDSSQEKGDWSPSQGHDKRRVSFSNSPVSIAPSPCPSPKVIPDLNYQHFISAANPNDHIDSQDISSLTLKADPAIETSKESTSESNVNTDHGQSIVTPPKLSQRANSDNSRITDEIDGEDSPIHSVPSVAVGVDQSSVTIDVNAKGKPSSKQRLEPIAVSDSLDSRPVSAEPSAVSEQLQKWIRPLLQPLAIRSQALSSKNLLPKPVVVAAPGNAPTNHLTETLIAGVGACVGVGVVNDDIDDEKSTASSSTGLPDRMFYKHGVLSISTLDSLYRVNTSQFLDAGEFDDSAIPGAVQRPRTNSSTVPAMLTKSIESIVCTKNRKIPTDILSTVRPKRKKFTSELNILQKKVLSLRSAANSKDSPIGNVGRTVYYGVEDTPFMLSLPMSDRYRASFSGSNSSEVLRNHLSDYQNNEDGSKTQRQVVPIGSMALMKGVKHKKLASLNRL